ncbi:MULTISPECIES: hypothetical protein [Derxia]|uniref:Uncharacterized protein n=1 Tax=Derxia gummosa DSM 723 TaxID=1121388 RepID=A0A9U5CZF3_9BURK|nr:MULTISPECIES: hypothetical protein [Derxia]
MTDATAVRKAILDAPLETSNHGETPQPDTIYAPLSHMKALRLDAHVVVGGRGVGKSFWTAALQSDSLRKTLRSSLRELDNVVIHTGFASKESPEFPNADALAKSLAAGTEPYDIWRAVILRWVSKVSNISIPMENWNATVTWLKEKPEAAVNLMQQPRSWRGLIIFDALDRTSADWQQMDNIVRGLLRAVLWLKTHPGLYAKVFLREDQAERTVFNFPDASKLLATKAELSWARHDLHGLLWQRLASAPDPGGQIIREICSASFSDGRWQLPDDMKRESGAQKIAFEKIAGPWMGRDRRRGIPYTWSIGHLADGRGQTSPRSFLAAIRQAAEDSEERYPSHEFALHFESIKRGIQKASDIRVAEVAEDYPWVTDILNTLRALNVPCNYSELVTRWSEKFPHGLSSADSDRLPAQHTDRGWDGIRDDLQRLGLIETKKDGRIDMPDLYRVGFGLGRKGGVAPKA